MSIRLKKKVTRKDARRFSVHLALRKGERTHPFERGSGVGKGRRSRKEKAEKREFDYDEDNDSPLLSRKKKGVGTLGRAIQSSSFAAEKANPPDYTIANGTLS